MTYWLIFALGIVFGAWSGAFIRALLAARKRHANVRAELAAIDEGRLTSLARHRIWRRP